MGTLITNANADIFTYLDASTTIQNGQIISVTLTENHLRVEVAGL